MGGRYERVEDFDRYVGYKGYVFSFLCRPDHVGQESDCGMGDIKKQGLDFKVRWERGTGTHSSIQVVHGGHVISVSEHKDWNCRAETDTGRALIIQIV